MDLSKETLLAIVDISAVQSPAHTFIYCAILFIHNPNNVWHNQAHWLIGMPYLSTIASNDSVPKENRKPCLACLKWIYN